MRTKPEERKPKDLKGSKANPTKSSELDSQMMPEKRLGACVVKDMVGVSII